MIVSRTDPQFSVDRSAFEDLPDVLLPEYEKLVRTIDQSRLVLTGVIEGALPKDGSEPMTGAIVFDPGSDIDMSLLKVAVTGDPEIKWDQVANRFDFNKGLGIDGIIITGGDSIEINKNNTGNRNAFIDFHGDDTWTDFAFRIIRENTGANADTILSHRGTGALALSVPEAGSITFSTSAIERVRIDSLGLYAQNDRASGFAAFFFNDGDNANRFGIKIQCGDDAELGTQHYILFFDGNDDQQGVLKNNTSGNMELINVSDKRIKSNIVDAPAYNTRAIIQELQLRNYDIRGSKGGKGFVAQEVQEVFPEMVSVIDEETGLLGVISETPLTRVLLQAMKEQQNITDQLITSIEALEVEHETT